MGNEYYLCGYCKVGKCEKCTPYYGLGGAGEVNPRMASDIAAGKVRQHCDGHLHGHTICKN